MLLKSQIFNNFSFKLILISSIFCVILSFFLSEFAQNLLIFSGILSFGIIHGANDILLLKKNTKNNDDSSLSLLIKYLALVISFGIFFYFIPFYALIFFVLFSSYHFGEHQWTMFDNNGLKKLSFFYFSYGLFLFSLLFWIHSSQLSIVIEDITKFQIQLFFYDYLLIISFVLMFFSGFINFKYILNQLFIQLILIILLSFIFYSTKLIYAFGIYFVFWHSIPSILEQSRYIYGKSDFKSIISYLKNAFVYWLISLIGLFIIYFLMKDFQNLLISIFFSFLAAITFPHAVIIFKIKRN